LSRAHTTPRSGQHPHEEDAAEGGEADEGRPRRDAPRPVDLGETTPHPVENHGDGDDGETGGYPPAGTTLAERLQHRRPETAGADEGRQHDDPQRHHDRLTQTGEDGGKGHRQLHLQQRLAVGGAEHLRGLDRRCRYLAYAQGRESDDRRKRVDHRRHRRIHGTDTEETKQRQKVDECRHRLHRVQYGPDRNLDTTSPGGQHSDRYPDEHCEENGRPHERQRLHRRPPQSDAPGVEQRRRRRRSLLPHAHPDQHEQYEGGEEVPGKRQQHRFETLDHPVEEGREGNEETGEEDVRPTILAYPVTQIVETIREERVEDRRKCIGR
jgi:hypothetical protein